MMCVCLIRWHQCLECETMPTPTHRQPNKQANFAVAKETVNLPYKTLLFARSFLTLFNSLFGFLSSFDFCLCVCVSSLSHRLPEPTHTLNHSDPCHSVYYCRCSTLLMLSSRVDEYRKTKQYELVMPVYNRHETRETRTIESNESIFIS